MAELYIERRKYHRMDLRIVITLTKVDEFGEPDSSEILDEISVQVLDISRVGIGFLSEMELDNGSKYQANIKLWTGDTITTVINVVRVSRQDDGTIIYGGTFEELPEKDWVRISVFDRGSLQ